MTTNGQNGAPNMTSLKDSQTRQCTAYNEKKKCTTVLKVTLKVVTQFVSIYLFTD